MIDDLSVRGGAFANKGHSYHFQYAIAFGYQPIINVLISAIIIKKYFLQTKTTHGEILISLKLF